MNYIIFYTITPVIKSYDDSDKYQTQNKLILPKTGVKTNSHRSNNTSMHE
mgnify:CR=1 FL=1